MAGEAEFDAWTVGGSYERYMGRWSRPLASAFLAWLDAPPGADWIDVGCGTGALTAAVLAERAPRSVLAVDPSEDFLAHARSRIDDRRVTFARAEAQRLPVADAAADVVGSALVLNFLPDRRAALAEMQRALRPDGLLGFYVWDYPGGGMEMIDVFWKTAAEIDAGAGALDEARRFDFCTRDRLAALCAEAGLREAAVEAIAVEIAFPGFEDFWQPFTLGAGPAPGYCASLGEDARAALKAALDRRLGDGPIRMGARAWAARGRRRLSRSSTLVRRSRSAAWGATDKGFAGWSARRPGVARPFCVAHARTGTVA